MKIDSYRFGKIIINGKEYNSDVKIFPDGVKDNWWRKQGHLLNMEDIIDVLDFEPELFIIGTGTFGVMKAAETVINTFAKLGIEVIVVKTSKACELYNELSLSKNTVAALHLTC